MYLSEANIRYEALVKLKEVQSKLVASSFLPVLSLMKSDNPLKKEIVEFQDKLDELVDEVAKFVKSAKDDVEYIQSKEEQKGEEEFKKSLKKADKISNDSTNHVKDPEKVTERVFIYDSSVSSI